MHLRNPNFNNLKPAGKATHEKADYKFMILNT
jgi:hypothetical protein